VIEPDSARFFNMRNNMIKAERRVLKELGFCVHIQVDAVRCRALHGLWRRNTRSAVRPFH
jgi:hypothetical protein